MHNERLTLTTICGGAVQEKVDRALKKVAENIIDPNTDPGKKRSITLKIVMKPNENDIEDVAINADVSYTLAPEIGVNTRFFVNKDLNSGNVTIMEHRKGEIKGQIDFGDLGLLQEPEKSEEKSFDTETGEIFEEGDPKNILDFRRNA